uniref:Uncharacterized protein PB18E9.04c n=1 Tax=Elaeis guineensis var. tenera TaxID=51953 RepID=A0A8N4F0Q5_ELAGV|nr:uncharacterized protein PB18E9.04c [Elaeis guineensis]
MNRPSKLGRKSSEETPAKKSETKKKPSPRNPLKELNGGGAYPPPSGSTDAPRGGCFGFLLSSSSSKGSLPKSKPFQRTPRSAPPVPRTLVSKNSVKASRFPGSRKNASQPSLEGSKQVKSKKPSKPRTPDLLQRWNRRKPSSEEQGQSSGNSLDGKNPGPELSSAVDFGGKVETLGVLTSGVCFASTPEKTLPGFAPEVVLETKEGEQKLSNTPTSATTPPIQASISPAVPAGPSVAPTSPCFAAGHVIAGIHDRRKCRPRGILTVGEGGPEVTRNPGFRGSSTPPPIAGASIHWLSSPSENVNSGLTSSFSSISRVRLSHCNAEASANWLLHPCEEGEEGVPENALLSPKMSTLANKCSPDLGNWNFSPADSNPPESPELGGLLCLNSPLLETTPSSGYGFRRTPSTGSSISPFSMILESVATSSKCILPKPCQERGGYRYGSALRTSSFSGESWVDIPSSYSSSRKQGGFSASGMDSVVDLLGTVKLSPNSKTSQLSNTLSSPRHSFQFGCTVTPSNSVDLIHFHQPSCTRTSAAKEACFQGQGLPSSETRISWRDGLVSRIFEMGELDCLQWLSDDEDNFNCHGEDNMQGGFDLRFKPNISGSVLEDGNEQHIASGFGSIEFACDETSVQKSIAEMPCGPISCLESFSRQGVELVSSGDSNWTLFYDNHLFEL